MYVIIEINTVHHIANAGVGIESEGVGGEDARGGDEKGGKEEGRRGE